jgi:hypothetical protein
MPQCSLIDLLLLAMFKTNQPKETMKKELITILKTAISLIQQENDLDFVLFFIKKSFKKMGVK